jgi:hypothetical protein
LCFFFFFFLLPPAPEVPLVPSLLKVPMCAEKEADDKRTLGEMFLCVLNKDSGSFRKQISKNKQNYKIPKLDN